ncbi:MAG: hypothetical protein ACYC48_00395 [Minisyncoccota bacterium]
MKNDHEHLGIEKRRSIFSAGVLSILFFILGGANTALAATITSTATGGNWTTGSTWVGGVVPKNTDSAVIATTGSNSVTIGANATAAAVTINSGAILSFTNASTLTVNGNFTVTGTVNGTTGIVKLNLNPSVIGGSGTINSLMTIQQPSSLAATASLTATQTITLNQNLTISSGAILSAVAISSNGKTLTNNGTVNLSGNYSRSGGTAVWTQGTNAVLNIAGIFTPAGNITLNATASGNVVDYNGGAQAVQPASYVNLTLDGSSGTKTVSTGTSVSGTLSIAPAGTATASIGAGLTITVANLTLGGLGRINGSWGSTSSTAAHQNNTYFAATTGILSVTNDTRVTPALSVTNSPVVYNASPQSAVVVGSVAGAASNVKYGGSSTVPTSAGTYAITADFTPTDTTSYKSLTAASAGSFVISMADQTITFTALPNKALGDPDFTVSATSTSGLPVSFASQTTGVCTASGTMVHLVSMGTCTIRASQGGDSNFNAAPTVDQSFTVAAGPAAVFALNNPGNMFARTRLGYTVTRFDAFGNTTSTGTTTAYLYTTSTSTTERFYNDPLSGSIITSIAITPGHSTANFWYYDEAPGTYTITASDNAVAPDGAAGIADATRSVTVNPVATQFVILPPASGTVDAQITVTVQAQKPDGSVDTNYQTGVTLNTSGSATGGGLVTIVNGVGTMHISDTVAETVNLSLTDSQNTGLTASSTQPVVFAGGAIAQFTLTHPATLVAGQLAAYTVTRKDQFGNISSPQATSTAYLYSSSTGVNKRFYAAATTTAAVITSVLIAPGSSTANFWYYDELPGAWSITASDNATAPDGAAGIIDAVDSLQVTAGPVATFLINHPGTMTAGTRLGYTITRKDRFNNLVTMGTTTAYVYSNSTGSSTPVFYDAATAGNAVASIPIPNGQSSAPVWYFDSNPGTWNVTVSDNATAPDGAVGIIDAVDAVTVSAVPIVATKFVILPPAAGTVDAAIPVTVEAQDSNGNIDTTYHTGVTLGAGGSATGGGLVTIVNGVGTISIADHTAQSVSLSLIDSQGTLLNVSSTQTAVFAPGAVAQFSLNHPGEVAAGTRIGYVAARKDQYGNAVTSGATTVYLYSTSTGVNKKFFDAASGGSAITSIIIPDGASSVGFWAYDEKAGNWFITASDNASAPDGAVGIADASDALTVQPAAAAKFVLNNPGNMTAGTRLGYIVARKDQFDNLVTAGVTLAYPYSTSTGTTTAFYATAAGGAPITLVTIAGGSSSGAFWYYDQTPGAWLITVSDSATGPNSTVIQHAIDSVTVSAVPIVATRFVILPPVSVQAGTPATVTVEAQDAAGNIDTTIQSGVTLSATGSAIGGGLVTIVNGIGTVTLRDTVAETVSLSLADTQSSGLDVSSTRTLLFSALPVVPAARGSAGPGPAPIPVVIGVQLSGLAFPKATIQILAVSPQGASVQGQTIAAANGSFVALLHNIQTGAGSYGLVAVDALGRTTQTKVFNATYANKDSLLTLSSTLLSPTLGLVSSVVRRHDTAGFIGMAVPGYTVTAQVDGKDVSPTATAGADGSYKILFPTGVLSLGSHTVRVRQASPDGARSDYAPQKVFNLTMLATPQTDFDQDGVVDLKDFSIFLARWNSRVPAIHMLDDLNGDGKVDVTDLSIFIRTLKQ